VELYLRSSIQLYVVVLNSAQGELKTLTLMHMLFTDDVPAVEVMQHQKRLEDSHKF
jgi:hypothetical protein